MQQSQDMQNFILVASPLDLKIGQAIHYKREYNSQPSKQQHNMPHRKLKSPKLMQGHLSAKQRSTPSLFNPAY
jgi:hypothetical protein